MNLIVAKAATDSERHGSAMDIPKSATTTAAPLRWKSKKGTEVVLMQYEHSKERQYLMPIRQMIGKDLSEPYSIYVYRYFLNNWPDLCWMVHTPVFNINHYLLIC
jgi:hypothetical protein